MTTAPLVRLIASLIASLAALWLASTPAAAAASLHGNMPYQHYARDTPLEQVLREFAEAFHLALVLSPQMGGVVNGQLKAGTPAQFLDQMGRIYGFDWFVHGGQLHVSHTRETLWAPIPLAAPAMPAMRRTLAALGVLDERYVWSEMPDHGLVVVEGPPAYVRLVQRTIAGLPLVTAASQQVAVFPLKHASVDDRVLHYRDRQITTPGLAQVLRNLVAGQGLAAGIQPATAEAGRANPSTGPQAPPSVRRAAPGIQADSRLNALIIQDSADRMPIYQALIEQLDRPSALIEIEAMIIDVNLSRMDELGISWATRQGGVAAGFGSVALSDKEGLSISAAGRTANISTGTAVLSVGDYLITRIRALESRGEASVQSRPAILTVDHMGALIDLSETFHIRVTGERVASVTPVTVGTSLRVTPHTVRRADAPTAIQLDIDIEDGQMTERTVDGLPTIQRSNVSTQAIVGDNQTLLVGGYNASRRVQETRGLPILGAIPLLGALFSQKSEDHKTRQRLFLIRPRVITLPGATAPEALATP